jgi:hypothetical protein
MFNSKLKGKVIPISELSDMERERMFELMRENYDCVEEETFRRDLAEKSDVILLRDNQDQQIQGFSTLMVLEGLVGGNTVKALFSGDTIIEETYWGDSRLEHLWGRYAFSLIDKNSNTPLFWFLMSKGYKTYRFLPVFFNDFYPRYDRPTPAYEQEVMDTFARKKFPLNYDAKRGLIVFDGQKDRLKQGLADIDERRMRDPNIRYFIERNPGWQKGDELCCITPLRKTNFNRMALRMIKYNRA